MNFSLRHTPHLQAALWKVLSFICFSVINGMVRFLYQEAERRGVAPLPAYEVALFQNLFGVLFLTPWVLRGGFIRLRSGHPLLQVLRVVLSACGVVLWYVTLTQMSLARAVALMFLGPIITAMGARWILGEVITRERAMAIAVGFVGGWMLSEPTLSYEGSFDIIVILPFLAALCMSGATLVIRQLAAVDTPQLTTAYLLLFMTPVLLVPTLFEGVMPGSWQWPWLVAMGGLAAAAHLLLSKAYSNAEVSYLIPYGLTKWGTSALIGLCAFGETPSLQTCLGALVLMSAVIALSYSDIRTRRSVQA